MKSLLRWTAASLAAVFLVSASQNSYSQVYDGNTTTNWAAGTTWIGGVPPAGATAITFADAPIGTTSTNDIVGLTLTGINFPNGGLVNATNTVANNTSFTLNGNKIILGGNIVTLGVAHDGVPSNNRILRDVINLDIDLNATRTFTTGQAGTNNQSQTQHHLTVNGNIGETAPLLGRIAKNGAGELELNGNNTFTNGIQITAGSIVFQTQNNLSTGVLRSSNGTFVYEGNAVGGSGNVTVNNAIDLYNTNNQGITLTAAGVANANNTITFNGTFASTTGTQTKTIQLNGANTGLNTFVANITNGTTVPTALTKAGNGRWVVSDNNSFTGLTNINAGTLNVGNLQDDLALPSSVGQNATLQFAGGQLRYANAGNTTTVISNRTISLPGTNAQGAVILNDSALTNNTLVLTGNFLIPAGTGTKTLTLSGSNTGSNIFNSVLPNSAVGGNTVLTKAGNGQWIVTGNNTYSGVTNVNAGTLTVLNIDDNVATAQPLGTNATTQFNGGQLGYAGSTSITISSNRTFSLVGSGQLNNSAVNGNSVIFNGNLIAPTGTAENNNTRTLTLGGGNTDTANSFNTVIADGASLVNGNGTFRKPVNLTKTGGGLWNVTGVNTFTGATAVNQGTLVVSSIGNKGVASNVGTGSEIGDPTGNTVGNATIRLGNGTTTGVLRYIGAGESTNRLFRIGQLTAEAVSPGNQTGGGQIINNGTGGLTLTGEGGFFNESVTANSAAARALTLGGSFAGVNNMNAIIQDNTLVGNGTNAQIRVIKNGATTWALNSANTYTGNTTVTAGTLLINGSTAGGDVLVTGGSLGGSGTVGGNTTITGANLSPGTSPGLLSFGGGLALGLNSTFTWELTGNTNAGRGTNFDAVDVAGALSIDPSVASTLNTSGGLIPGDAFWSANRSWLVFDSAGNSATGLPGGAIGGSLVSGLAGVGSFAWANTGGDIFLNYTAAVPEPSSLLLTVLGIAGFGMRRSRKNRS